MRLTNSQKPRFQTRALVTILLAAGLAACGSTGGSAPLASVSAVPDNGPQADYPILVGDAYQVAGTTYTPADVLNYDEVGFVALESATMGYTGAHHTLPVPSYAEVTSLETGRTVLVRLERRGPMDSNHVLALSPAAMAQLGASAETAVRVRRVNPPEDQRAMLRSGQAAPLRMDTPESLLTVLRRRVPASGTASLAASMQLPRAIESVEVAASTATPDAPELPPVEETASVAASVATAPAPQAPSVAPPLAPLEPVASAAPAGDAFAAAFESEGAAETPPETVEVAAAEPPAPVPSIPQELEGGFVVQAAAFSSQDNARRAANALGASVTQAGQYFRVRTGPFATRGEAEASLANVRRAGYSDARILTSG